MKTIYKYLFLLLLLLIAGANSNAQTEQIPATALSPNAANLGLYGEIPVSLYTGTPDISIPLYDLKVKDFTLPVSLGYHASGVRVDQHPSWVGSGWSLFAGGVITRSINDMPDDYNNSKYFFGDKAGYYYTYTVLYPGQWNHSHSVVFKQNILPTKEEITFTYERKEYNNQMYIAVHHDLGSWTEASGGLFNPQPKCSYSNSSNSVYYHYAGKLISPVYLKEITAPQATISFKKSISDELRYDRDVYDYKYSLWLSGNFQYPAFPLLKSQQEGYPDCLKNLKWYKLDSIIIKQNTETLKSIAFGYNNSATQRLSLNRITESGKNPYSFDYYNVNSLPGYMANKSDHWGFYNNTYAYITNHSNYYNYRNPDSLYTKYGILNKIIYPTGGYTILEFEPHDYRKQLREKRWETPLTEYSSNQLAGGVRIKKIISSSTHGSPDVIKEYYYVSDYLQNKGNAQVSSGVLGGQVRYYFDDYIVYAFNDKDIKRKMAVFSSISVLPSCQNISGSHIGYTDVIEKMADNSFIHYQFTNFDNGYMDKEADAVIQVSRTPYEPYNSKAMERGLLLLKEDHNATGKKVKSVTTQYEKNMSSVRAMNASYKNVCPATAVCYDEGASYEIYTYLLQPGKETETYYDTNNGQTLQQQEKTYKYNSEKLISEMSMLRSDGKKQTTKFSYPFEIKQGTDTAALRKMTDKHILSDYVEKLTYTGNETNAQVIEAEYRHYDETSANSGIFRPVRIDVLRNQDVSKMSMVDFNQVIYLSPIDYYLDITNTTYPANYGHPLMSVDTTITLLYQTRVKLDFGFTDHFMAFVINGVNVNYKYGVSTKPITMPNFDYIKCIENYKVSSSDLMNIRYSEAIELPPGTYHFLLAHGETHTTQYFGGACKIEFLQQRLVLGNNSPFPPEMYYRYDSKGNMIESKPAGSQVATAYLWGYKYQYPIAKIENATCDQVKTALGETLIDRVASADSPSVADLTAIYNLRSNANLPDVQVTTYSYKPLIGLQTVIDPRGMKTTYQYDSFGRLEAIKDENGKKIEEYMYHYKEQ